MPEVKHDYYSVLAGLSAFEASQNVSFTEQELEEFSHQQKQVPSGEELGEDGNETKSNTNNFTSAKRMPPVHGYLGGRVDIKEAARANYDLSHTLLGGYVPKRQLEQLVSLDFAHFFNKNLECKSAIQVCSTFAGPANSPVNANTNTGSPEELRIQQEAPEVTLPDGRIKHRVLECVKCHQRFRGPDRLRLLKQHSCQDPKSPNESEVQGDDNHHGRQETQPKEDELFSMKES